MAAALAMEATIPVPLSFTGFRIELGWRSDPSLASKDRSFTAATVLTVSTIALIALLSHTGSHTVAFGDEIRDSSDCPAFATFLVHAAAESAPLPEPFGLRVGALGLASMSTNTGATPRVTGFALCGGTGATACTCVCVSSFG